MSKHNHNQLELVTLKPKSIEDPFLLLMPLRAALLSYFYLSVLLSLYLAERPSKPSDMPAKHRFSSGATYNPRKLVSRNPAIWELVGISDGFIPQSLNRPFDMRATACGM